MAELIRKDKLIDWTYRVPQYYDSMNDRTDMRDFINGLPTTTEAEIRNRAIDEFAEKLKESLMKNYRHFITTDTDGFDWLTTDAVGTHIDEIAEQLKEE